MRSLTMAQMVVIVQAAEDFMNQFDSCLGNSEKCDINYCMFCEHDYTPQLNILRQTILDSMEVIK